jgi:hypothetical protein
MRSLGYWMNRAAVAKQLRRTCLAMVIMVLLAGKVAPTFAASPGADAAAPEKQQESDWVDARWSQTDLGRFHASILPLPKGIVAKGLSVRLGEKGEAAVAYDTASASLRAGWTRGFLNFSGARYGLIQSPKPAGEIHFLSPAPPAWGNVATRWRGLHVHGPRLVLDYEVAGVAIQESPWYETAQEVAAFTRVLDLAPASQSLSLALIEGDSPNIAIHQLDGVTVASVTRAKGVVAAAISGDLAELRSEEGVLKLHFPITNAPRRIKLFRRPASFRRIGQRFPRSRRSRRAGQTGSGALAPPHHTRPARIRQRCLSH